MKIGDEVLGPTDIIGAPVAGIPDFAIPSKWVRRPDSLDPVIAASLAFAIESARVHPNLSKADAGKTILINRAGMVVKFRRADCALAWVEGHLHGRQVVCRPAAFYWHGGSLSRDQGECALHRF